MSRPEPVDITDRYSRVTFGVAVLVGTDNLSAWSRKNHVDERQPRENAANLAKPIRLFELGPGWIGMLHGDVMVEVPVANIVSRCREARKEAANR